MFVVLLKQKMYLFRLIQHKKLHYLDLINIGKHLTILIML